MAEWFPRSYGADFGSGITGILVAPEMERSAWHWSVYRGWDSLRKSVMPHLVVGGSARTLEAATAECEAAALSAMPTSD